MIDEQAEKSFVEEIERQIRLDPRGLAFCIARYGQQSEEVASSIAVYVCNALEKYEDIYGEKYPNEVM